MSQTEAVANERKLAIDALTAELLKPNHEQIKEEIVDPIAAYFFDHENWPINLCITGGAGAGKTTVAKLLSAAVGSVPVFDFDEFIPGGYTKNPKEYRARLMRGLMALWEAIPAKGGWIIDHVESCNEEFIKSFRPNFALYIHQPGSVLVNTARARAQASGEKDSTDREQRALESAEYAKLQFKQLQGVVVLKNPTFKLKKITK
jgi:shikimate kinase